MPTGSSTYPTTIDTFAPTRADGDLVGPDVVKHAAALGAIETALGVNPSGSRYNVFNAAGAPYSADTTGAADARDAIQDAIDACYTAGGGIVYLPPGTYKLSSNNGAQKCLLGRGGVSILGAGPDATSLVLGGAINTGFIHATSTLGTAATITANVTAGMQNYTVGSSAGFTAGDVVSVKLGDNPSDSAETKEQAIGKVTAVPDSTHITLDYYAQEAVTVASQATANKQITKITELIEGCSYGGFSMISDGSVQNAEQGIEVRYTRNCHLHDIYGEHVGAGLVIAGYCTNLTGRNWHVGKCKAQNAQASKGRGFVIWNGRNIKIEGLIIEDFEGVACFIESYSDGVVIDGLDIRNTAATRNSNAILFVVQSSRTLFRNVLYSGRTASQDFFDVGGSPDYSTIENITFRCDMFALLNIPLSKFKGVVKHLPSTGAEQFDFGQVEEHTVDVTLVDAMNTDVYFPDGILLSSDIYVSPGVTAGEGSGKIDIYQGRTGDTPITRSFTAGSLVRRQHEAGTNWATSSDRAKAVKFLVYNNGGGLTGLGKHAVIRTRTVKPLESTTVGNEPGSEQYQRFLPLRTV